MDHKKTNKNTNTIPNIQKQQTKHTENTKNNTKQTVK